MQIFPINRIHEMINVATQNHNLEDIVFKSKGNKKTEDHNR